MISGENVINQFKLEPGIHRVQRVPPTESKGRRHTSTLAVAVLPYYEEDELKYNKSEFRIECTAGQGPGGQHRNKHLTAIKITHIPTGLTAYSDGRSQYRNKENAMKVILARLKQKGNEEKHDSVNSVRSEQIGNMGRGTRVRTYNFIRNEVSDERIKKKFRTEDVMNGKLDLIYKNV